MVLGKFGSSLRGVVKKITSSLFLDDAVVNDLVKEIQRTLISSDVDVHLVLDISKNIKTRFKKEKEPSGLSQKEFFVNIVYEELTKLMGEKFHELDTSNIPTKIMLIGLFGSGKTTTTGKLAKYYKKKGKKVAVVETDTWRPAAHEQLKQISEQVDVDFYGVKESKNPVEIYRDFEKRSKNKKYDIIIIDTAGRDALDEGLEKELTDLMTVSQPHERLLVINGDIGQAAKKQSMKFHEVAKITGVIITKLDGTSKGGGAITACFNTKAPVKFIGVGEKIEDLEVYDPVRFVSRLLGMGDLKSLLEKAEEASEGIETEDLGRKFLEGKFNLLDLFSQIKMLKKMGSFSKIMSLIPGMSNLSIPKEVLDVQETKMHQWRHLMDSMTKEELENPDILAQPRVERIAKGSGHNPGEVRELIKYYNQSKKMTKMMSGGGGKKMKKMMQKMGIKSPDDLGKLQGKLPQVDDEDNIGL